MIPTTLISPRRKAGFFSAYSLNTQTGESRAFNTTRMGDVVLIDTGDGVFTRQ